MELPTKQIREFLADWYDKQVQSSLRVPKKPDDLAREGGTVFDLQPELSSINAIPVLLGLKDILGFEPSKKVIKRGGYRSRDEFVETIVKEILVSISTAENLVSANGEHPVYDQA